MAMCTYGRRDQHENRALFLVDPHTSRPKRYFIKKGRRALIVTAFPLNAKKRNSTTTSVARANRHTKDPLERWGKQTQVNLL